MIHVEPSGRPRVIRRAWLAALFLLVGAALTAAEAAPATCTAEAATLERVEADLPKMEVTSPDDRPVLCITIETLMAFANRLKAHVAHCPNSNYAAAAVEWEKNRQDFVKQFTQHKCRRTLPN
jgi:hypothetical protein